MVVDYLRSCYSAGFELDNVAKTVIGGRFYFAPPSAEVYKDWSYVRSSVYLDPWDQDDGPGDHFVGSTWYDGTPPLSVVNTLAGTKKASVDCDKPLHIVPGSGGFPLKCDGRPVGVLNVTWNPTIFRNAVTLGFLFTGSLPFPGQDATYLGNGRYQIIPLLMPMTGIITIQYDAGSWFVFGTLFNGSGEEMDFNSEIVPAAPNDVRVDIHILPTLPWVISPGEPEWYISVKHSWPV